MEFQRKPTRASADRLVGPGDAAVGRGVDVTTDYGGGKLGTVGRGRSRIAS